MTTSKHNQTPTPDMLDRFHRKRVLDDAKNLTPTDHSQPGKRQDSTPNKVTPRNSTQVQAIIDGNRDHMRIPHGRDSYLDKVTGNGTRAGSSTRANPSLGSGGAGRLNDATASMGAGATKGSRRLNDDHGSPYGTAFGGKNPNGGRSAKLDWSGVRTAAKLEPKSRNERPRKAGKES